jgi:hypothetical protein
MLCKTAFSVIVERAAKLAISRGHRLLVLPGKCNKPEDASLTITHAAATIRAMKTKVTIAPRPFADAAPQRGNRDPFFLSCHCRTSLPGLTDPLQIGGASCGESGFEGFDDQCTRRFGVVREYL